MRYRSVWTAACLALGALAIFTTAPLQASGVVTDCSNDAEFSAKLGGGGAVSFNCGTVTIIISSTKTISADTTIDGGNKITLTGESGRRLLSVNSGVTLTLKNIVLDRGYGGNTDGGAIYNAGHLILDHTTIQSSTDSSFGGGAIATMGQLDVTNSTFANNKAGKGGAIYASGADAQVTISGSTFHDNEVIQANSLEAWGGALYIGNGASLDLSASFVNNNKAAYGGGIATELGSLTLSNVTLSGNKAQPGNGGGIDNAGTAYFFNVTLSNNTATNLGGGLQNTATATLTNVTLSNNEGNIGAGIQNSGPLALTNVTISGNSAGFQGGGLNNYRTTATLTNVTLFGNSAPTGKAGGIWNENHADSHLHLTNVVIADSGGTGGNCNFGKGPETVEFDLSSDNTCSFGESRDGANLLLGPLANNGGMTNTHLPQPGSPAIDNGTYVITMLLDQRGVARPQGTKFDVGSVEVACAKPDKPVLLKPKNNGKIKTTTPTLDWDDVRCATTYKVTVRKGSTTGAKVFGVKNLTESQTTITTPLIHGQTYYWRVTPKNNNGKSHSDWRSFKVR